MDSKVKANGDTFPTAGSHRIRESDSMTSPYFATTRWSIVLAAGDRREPTAALALRDLCEAYWYPLYAFARRDGATDADAMDLVQGFLADLLARGELGAAPDRGRFRSYLIGALRNYRNNKSRAERTQKRGGDVASWSLDDAEARYGREPADRDDPEALFERRWATTLLDRALERLEQEYRERRREGFFEELKDVLTGSAITNYAEKARSLGVTESVIKVSVHRMRGRMRELLREEVAQTVADTGAIDDEIQHLFTVLAR